MKPVMRQEPLLATQPPAPVRSIGELYAIAISQAGKAAQRYGELAAAGDDAFEPVRCVFEVLNHRELERIDSIKKDSFAAIGRAPDMTDLRWTPTDLVPAEELSDVENSLLSTAYGAWALAVRHRERAFVFWTYVAALAESVAVRNSAEDLAREALRDGNLLRRERRLAWRAERKSAPVEGPTTGELSTAALLESLLLNDILLWSQDTPPPQQARLLSLIGSQVRSPALSAEGVARPQTGSREEIKRRALRHAEQLSMIYLDEADRAIDQCGLELAQQLATRSIARLADLRTIASLAG